MSRTTKLWNDLAEPADRGIFRPERLAELPDPAKRYLAHAIRPGAKLAGSVQLAMEGTIRLGLKWLPFRAEQVLAPPRGFVWRAFVRSGLMRMSGADHYAAGSGGVDFWLWGIIPMVRASSPDTSCAARGRLAAESFWLPSSLLPGEHVRWRPVDVRLTSERSIMSSSEVATRCCERGGRLHFKWEENYCERIRHVHARGG